MHVPGVEIGANNVLLGAQNQDVKVSVRASLTADEKIDCPTSGDPPSRPTLRKQPASVLGRQWRPRSKVLCSHRQILAPDPSTAVTVRSAGSVATLRTSDCCPMAKWSACCRSEVETAQSDCKDVSVLLAEVGDVGFGVEAVFLT